MVAHHPVHTEFQAGGLSYGRDEADKRQEFIVGDCATMREVFERIRRFSKYDAPVLISGETGTGKELAAQAIHQRSERKNGPFIAINCAALPATLIASELFGYEKGAFTGALTRKLGLIEQANNGTLFLDEIGDLPLDLQAHMLRFLQEHTITRLGGHAAIQVNARVISASHVNLEAAMAAGIFRDDLFYRLNVLPLRMPSLRERESDLLLLATYFLRRITKELGTDGMEFTPEAKSIIQAYSWPGNVREMIAAVRRAVVMSSCNLIRPEDLAIQVKPEIEQLKNSQVIPLARRFQPGSEQERSAVLQALARNRNNVTKAAAEIGVSRVTFYRMAKRHPDALQGVFRQEPDI
ncbi:MAG: sigma-54 dependent transcriptional regulator [Acidocella sp.]|nr:sigma-54 dependent transcriptional regulator [Acidocella sp.]